MPKVSVIVPVYNVAEFLPKCVNSLLAQTYEDYEIILVDDGSTDNSGALCDSYDREQEKISVIHQQNLGQGGARNTGIVASRGEYLLFVDSDDYVHPHLLEYTVTAAETHHCDMVVFDAVAVYPDETRGSAYCCPLPRNQLVAAADAKHMLFFSGVWNRLWKKSLFARHGISFPTRVWYEDLYVAGKMAAHFESVYYVSGEPLYYYLQREGSTMHSPNFERITRERISAGEAVQQYYEARNLQQQYSRELEFMWQFHCFFLPVREMCGYGLPFSDYAKTLKRNACKYAGNPVNNPYFATLSKKEKLLVRLFWSEQYWVVKLLAAVNRFRRGK